MELKTIKEFANKGNLGEGLKFESGLFQLDLDGEFNTIASSLNQLNTKVTLINELLGTVYKVQGSTTVEGINSISVDNTTIGYVYNLLDSGTITNGISGELVVDQGDNVVYTENGWDKLSATAKMALEAGDNISIEDNVISALGYKYDAEKNSFSVGSGNATGQNSYAEGINTIAFGKGSHTEGKGVIAALTGYNWDLDSTSISFTSTQSTQYTTITIGSVLKIENNGENLFVKITAISDDKLTFTVDKPISLECDENSSLLFVTGIALGDNSHVEGYHTTASGNASHAEGQSTTASGSCSHAEGVGTKATGNTSHAEGQSTTASGYASHAEGSFTTAYGSASHAEGNNTTASGAISHAEGNGTIASNNSEHAQGQYNISNKNSDSFGDAGNTIHSIGIGTSKEARVNAQEVMQNGDFYVINVGGYDGTNINDEGVKTLQEVLEDISDGANYTAGDNISIENNTITAKGYVYNEDKKSFSEGDSKAIGLYSHAEGAILESLVQSMLYSYDSTSGNEDLLKLETDEVFANVGDYLRVYDVINGNSFIFEVIEVDAVNKTIKVDKPFLDYGINPKGDNIELYALTGGFAIGGGSHSEGMSTSLGVMSHSEGHHTKSIGIMSHAEGNYTEAFGDDSHAEGGYTTASGTASHAEGAGTAASGQASHAEGSYTTASGDAAHAEGDHTIASGDYSHAEGEETIAAGRSSHAEGCKTITTNAYEHAQGGYNLSNTGENQSDKTLHSIGIGVGDLDRKNAHEVMLNGDTYIIGIGDYDGTNIDSAKTLQEVINELNNKEIPNEIYVGTTVEGEPIIFIDTDEENDIEVYTKGQVDSLITEVRNEIPNPGVTSFNGETGDINFTLPSTDHLATKEELTNEVNTLNEKISNIVHPEDLVKSVNGLVGEVVLEIPSIEGLATTEELNSAISALNIPEINNLVTQEQLQLALNTKEYSLDFKEDLTTIQEINISNIWKLNQIVGYNVSSINLSIDGQETQVLTLIDNNWVADSLTTILIYPTNRIVWEIIKADETLPAVLGISKIKQS